MSQYNLTITYIRGEDNTVADVLSRLPLNCFPEENPDCWTDNVTAILTISSDCDILEKIKVGYLVDEFCMQVARTAMKGWTKINDLWYIGDRLLIPQVTDIWENLFRLAHNTLGHFGADKSYASLRDAYYWPNMRQDLEKAYIPSCTDCLRNKSPTTRPPGPLHPLPVPNQHASSIAMDFIGPLPTDEGYNCIVTITDRLGSDIWIVPTKTTITAKELAVTFFDIWYCENGLPNDIVCDRDKIFVSRFWKVLTKLTGVKLKMSSAYHPETDGSSERSNKTVNQLLRYHVKRNQKGWVHALPRIRFQIMNTVNASTGFLGFQLHLGRSPRVMPPIVPQLLLTKITQAFHASATRPPDPMYKNDDLVMLSTVNQRHEYKKKGEKHSTKFFPRWDGPYRITDTHPEASTYTLDIKTNAYPVYHVSLLKPHHANDNELFPSWRLAQPGPILTDEGLKEFFVEEIIDSRRRGHGWQFLVHWVGYGPEHNLWIPSSELTECEALDRWYELGGDGPNTR